MSQQGTLVVFYSRTGTTRKLGRQIAETLGADVDEVIDRKDRSGALGYLASGKDALARKEADIKPPSHEPSHYDLVVIGTPVWAFSVSCPIRTYLTRQKERLPRVAFFLTTGGSGIERTFEHMEELAGKPPVATLGLRMKDVLKDRHTEELRTFVEALRGKGPVNE
jgi:flavodoxin